MTAVRWYHRFHFISFPSLLRPSIFLMTNCGVHSSATGILRSTTTLPVRFSEVRWQKSWLTTPWQEPSMLQYRQAAHFPGNRTQDVVQRRIAKNCVIQELFSCGVILFKHYHNVTDNDEEVCGFVSRYTNDGCKWPVNNIRNKNRWNREGFRHFRVTWYWSAFNNTFISFSRVWSVGL